VNLFILFSVEFGIAFLIEIAVLQPHAGVLHIDETGSVVWTQTPSHYTA
jgi:hypothetical protein